VISCCRWRCALRAPTAFSARIKGIRPENAVLIKTKNGFGVLFEIVDCTRMAFHPGAIGDPRGRDAVRAIPCANGWINTAGALARCARQPRFD